MGVRIPYGIGQNRFRSRAARRGFPQAHSRRVPLDASAVIVAAPPVHPVSPKGRLVNRPDRSRSRFAGTSLARRPLLSAREKEVLLAWLASDSKTVAAKQLYISVGTLNTHVQRIRLKYAAAGRDAPTKASLLARAIQDGLTTLDEW